MINKKIRYALRDEILNIFAMTYGEIPTLKYKQIMICKKKKFSKDKLGPFLLDPKRSKATYIKSEIGKQYEQHIEHKIFGMKYIAFVEEQIEIKPSLALFKRLKEKGLFSLWEEEVPFKYFTGCEKGYLVLFRVYKIEQVTDETILEKGRSGRNYYYGLTKAIDYTNIVPVVDDKTYNIIKRQIKEIVYNCNVTEKENREIVYTEKRKWD